MKLWIASFFLIVSCCAYSQSAPLPVGTVLPVEQVPVHDPAMIKEGDKFYVFCTGMGITVWSSKDLKNWTKELPVFAEAPQWAVDTIPGFKGHIWAPDISYHNGVYYLYYSVSAFGKNTSAIGVATNRTLNSSSPDFKWKDEGRVIQSYPGKTPWNAIDPNLIVDKSGNAFLAFGSFWGGLKLVRLSPDFLKAAQSVDQLLTIASRRQSDTSRSANPIEAPFIFQKADWFYLFASIDYCCRGVNSTYKIIVGRSQKIEGPFLDRQGNQLAHGGGTVLLQGSGQWHGVGHNGTCSANGKDFIVYHGYDAGDKGKSKLIIQQIIWDADGWPTVALQ